MAEGKVPVTRSITSQVGEIFQCAICLELPNVPKLLPCFHVFCLSCLEQNHAIAKQKGLHGTNQIQCPLCRSLSDVPQGDLTQLVTDFRALQVADLVAKRQASKQQTEPEAITKYAEDLHQMIEETPAKVKSFLNSLDKDSRQKVLSELVDNNTALTWAILNNNFELVIYLLEEHQVDINQPCLGINEQSGKHCDISPLTIASITGNVAITEILIKHGAQVNKPNTEGQTALHAASIQGHLVVVICLVEAGAMVNMQSAKGVTSIMNAKNKPKIRQYLLSKGADPKLCDMDGFTALSNATWEGCIESVKVLLKYGSDVNVQGKLKSTPLHEAVDQNHMDIVELLLDNGADPYIKDSDGYHSFSLAKEKGDQSMYDLMTKQWSK